MSLFYIKHKELGFFIDEFIGLGFFQKSDIHTNKPCKFGTYDEAQTYLDSWKDSKNCEVVEIKGTTSNQMLNAPDKSLYVWHTVHLDYPIRLAFTLGREDLIIISRSAITKDYFRGRRFPEIILDHYTYLTDYQNESYKEALIFSRDNND